MKRCKQITIVLIILSSMSSACYGQCDFQTFVSTYFDVYEKSDTLVHLETYGKGGHKWQLKENDDCYDCAVKYFPSKNWFSACAYYTSHRYLLEFSEEVYTDSSLIYNSMLVLCDKEGNIIDRYTIFNTYVEYADVRRKSIWSQYYSLKNKIIWRLYKDTEDGECTEKQFLIEKNRIVPL